MRSWRSLEVCWIAVGVARLDLGPRRGTCNISDRLRKVCGWGDQVYSSGWTLNENVKSLASGNRGRTEGTCE